MSYSLSLNGAERLTKIIKFKFLQLINHYILLTPPPFLGENLTLNRSEELVD